MFPPSQSYTLDIEAISGICGSVSIACWVVVFSPQIIENFRRSSAEGLSIEFIIIWLFGDFANIIGAVLQGVLPTMIILAIYYTLADIVLLAQCFYYRGFSLRDPKPGSGETAPLLAAPVSEADLRRQSSLTSFSEHFANLGEHFSPATPMHPPPKDSVIPPKPRSPRPLWKAVLFNAVAILVVVAAGIVGYFLSPAAQEPTELVPDHPTFNLWGQIFGYLCAVLYLGSRVPQLLLNYRRKSTEGLNALFFLFACIGNLTYVLSIFAFEPICRHKHCYPGESKHIYGQYILVNLSWLIGSLGTLFLDGAVFVQFFLYRKEEYSDSITAIQEAEEEA